MFAAMYSTYLPHLGTGFPEVIKVKTKAKHFLL